MKALLPVLAAAALTGAATVPALAQSVAPVAIVDCAPAAGQYNVGPTQAVGNPVIPVSGSSDLAITFLNQSPQVVTSIELALTADGRTENVTETGALAPNAEASYQIAGDVLDASNAQCAVIGVTYADGSTWHA